MCRCSHGPSALHDYNTIAVCAVQVPSAGILTNGTAYIFYKCHHDGQPVVTCSEFMPVKLHKGISARSAEDAVMKVVRTMVQLFVDQQKALSSFWSQKASSNSTRNLNGFETGELANMPCVQFVTVALDCYSSEHRVSRAHLEAEAFAS